jgi:hypothetical protein
MAPLDRDEDGPPWRVGLGRPIPAQALMTAVEITIMWRARDGEPLPRADAFRAVETFATRS